MPAIVNADVGDDFPVDSVSPTTARPRAFPAPRDRELEASRRFVLENLDRRLVFATNLFVDVRFAWVRTN